MPSPLINFGNVEGRPGERSLIEDGVLHRPGSRAFDIPLYLIANAGRGVSKESMRHCWPGMVVGDNNPTVQISSLRKLPGPNALVTLLGKGYQFTLAADGIGAVLAPPPAQGVETQDLPLPDRPSVAVLPFDFFSSNNSDDSKGMIVGEHLADGIAEDLTTELSRFHSLFVIARNSCFTYNGRAVDVRQGSRELGVRYVVAGSVRRNGSALRITAQLVDALQGQHVWSNKFDGAMEDVFAIQDEIVRIVSQAIAFGVDQAHP